jgi:hypothetical protein
MAHVAVARRQGMLYIVYVDVEMSWKIATFQKTKEEVVIHHLKICFVIITLIKYKEHYRSERIVAQRNKFNFYCHCIKNHADYFQKSIKGVINFSVSSFKQHLCLALECYIIHPM